MTDDPFDSARQKRMRAAFDKAVKDGAYHSIADPQLSALEERLERVSEKLQNHLNKHKKMWIGREYGRLVEKHKGRLKPTLSPKWIVQTETSPAALLRQAYMIVENHNSMRLAKLNQIADRLRTRLGPDDPDGSPPNRNRMSM